MARICQVKLSPYLSYPILRLGPPFVDDCVNLQPVSLHWRNFRHLAVHPTLVVELEDSLGEYFHNRRVSLFPERQATTVEKVLEAINAVLEDELGTQALFRHVGEGGSFDFLVAVLSLKLAVNNYDILPFKVLQGHSVASIAEAVHSSDVHLG